MPAFPRGRPGARRSRGSAAAAPVQGPLLDPVTSARSPGTRAGPRGRSASPPADGARAGPAAARAAGRAPTSCTRSPTESGGDRLRDPAERGRRQPGPADDADAPGGTCSSATSAGRSTPGTATVVDQLDGAPCLLVALPRARCAARPRDRTTSTAGCTRRRTCARIVAREHTSLLDDETRLQYENGFKQPAQRPAGAERPGRHADAGDGHRHRRPVRGAARLAAPDRRLLPAAGRPGRPAHRQRARPGLRHRPGRAAAPARRPAVGDQRRRSAPPATYLHAEEILRRQYIAHLVDCFARDRRPAAPAQGRAARSGRPSPALPRRADRARRGRRRRSPRPVPRRVRRPSRGRGRRACAAGRRPADGEPGTSGLAAHLYDASQRWAADRRDARSTGGPRSSRPCPSCERRPRSPGRDRRRPARPAVGARRARG